MNHVIWSYDTFMIGEKGEKGVDDLFRPRRPRLAPEAVCDNGLEVQWLVSAGFCSLGFP